MCPNNLQMYKVTLICMAGYVIKEENQEQKVSDF